MVSAYELMDFLIDFEDSLSFTEAQPAESGFGFDVSPAA
jgi:hypothetical protein